MNFRQIELALDLARTLNYRMTAENMFISQPALTHQIKALEQEIGVALFHRSSRGVTLTPAGAVFCREMQKTVRSTREAISVARNCGGLFDETLRIALNARRTRDDYSLILRRCSAKHPHVLCDFRSGGGLNQLNAFLQREMDAVFYIDESIPASDALERCELFSSRIYCVTDRAHPLAARPLVRPEDLNGERMMFNDGMAPRALLGAQKSLCEQASPVLHFIQDTDTALLWVSAGQGVALMPGFCHDGSDRLAWIPYDWKETIPCSIAWHRDDHRPYLEDFIAVTKGVFDEKKEGSAVL